MRIPHIVHTRQDPSSSDPIEIVEVDIHPEQYIDDLSIFEDKKSYMKFLYTTEAIIRKSFEYEELISFIKKKHGLDHCGVHPNQDSKNGFRIELHHTPFQLSDITSIIINKRMKCGESLKMQAIAHEVMAAHYLDMVGIYPLCMLCHTQVHSEKMDPMFIPMRTVYGHPELFAEVYGPYMTDSMKNKWNNIKVLEQGHTIIEEHLPPELKRKFIYIKPFKDEPLEVVGTNKLIDFVQRLQVDSFDEDFEDEPARDKDGYIILRRKRVS